MTSRDRQPIETSPLIGRDADLSALAERLDAAKLVTVIGPGGVGKTRLAQRLGRERNESFSAHDGGGVYFVDLTAVRDAAGIEAAVADALGVKVRRERRTLGEAIARRGRVLVVLDNFEQVVAHARDTVGAWLAAASSARFLVTSRIPLDLSEEHLFHLQPLDEEAAAELFARRVHALKSAFNADAERTTIISIVNAIDRLPLAIELAATRMTVLSATQLRQRLETSRSLLTSRNDDGRHGSMRRVVLDSVEMIAEPTRRVFGACAVFRNGFTLEAAEAVLGDVIVPRAEVIDHVDALVRASLLRSDAVARGSARYTFLETVRDIADERMATDPARNKLRERTAIHFAAAGSGGDAADVPNRVAAHGVAIELGRADLALEIALLLEPVLTARGLSREVERMFDVTIAHLGRGDPRAHHARGVARLELGLSEPARTDFETAFALARDEDAPLAAAVALTRLGELSDIGGDTAAARRQIEEALTLLSRAPNDDARALCEAEAHLLRGHADRREGALARARASILRAAACYRALHRDDALASALYELAVIAMFAGDHEEAFARFDEGLAVARRDDVRVMIGALQTARGCLLQDLGRTAEALTHHAEAATIFREAGSRYREASALYYLATTYLERGEPAEAVLVLGGARERLEGVGAARYEALMASAEACALVRMEEPHRAAEALARAERAAAQVKNERALLACVRIHHLSLACAAGEIDVAAALTEAETLVRESPNDDSRFALRMLRTLKSAPARAEPLRIARDGAWFEVPNGERVSLPEKSPLRRIVKALAERRKDAPGDVLTIDELIAAGWPAEKITSEAALNRAYVALASLRKMGLRAVLEQGGGGYALSQAVVLRLED